MTVDSSNTKEFDIARLVYTAYRYAVLIAPGEELTTEQLTEGTEALERLMRQLDTEGTPLRQVRYDVLELTAESEWVNLGGDVIDVGHLAMYIPAGTADTSQAANETPAKRVYRDKLHGNSAKDATGNVVTMFRLDKEQLPYRLELWPIPNEDGYLRIEAFRLAANSTDGSKTVDRERHFFECLVNGVAHILAKSNGVGLERVMMLKKDHLEALNRCMGQEKDVVDRQFTIGHRSGMA